MTQVVKIPPPMKHECPRAAACYSEDSNQNHRSDSAVIGAACTLHHGARPKAIRRKIAGMRRAPLVRTWRATPQKNKSRWTAATVGSSPE